MCKQQTEQSLAVSPYRLPRTVLPERYELRLIPDLEAATFQGSVTIHVCVSEPVAQVVLNAIARSPERPEGLLIDCATISNEDGCLFSASVSTDPALERATLSVAGKIGKGRWQIKLTFTGVLNDKLKGFYRSRVQAAGEPDSYLACTQFQATDARLAFPCFDEPDMKAVFQVRLVVDKAMQALSNMRAIDELMLDDGRKEVVFAPSFMMPTYLLAFVVGNLTASETVNVDGIPVRLWCVPGKLPLTNFALAATAFFLRYFTKYFERSYCGDKLDLIAIPDFAAGAMENPGCITFREEALLVDPKVAPLRALLKVADTDAHELAHLWFGDYVTPAWWNGLWLNEAFATWAALKAVDAWQKSWRIFETFGQSRRSAMTIDALASTRPVEVTVNHPDDAAAMFDVLTYEKGAAVMRMLELWLGEEVFRRGLVLYMHRHAFGNTEGKDLWAALEEVSGQPVSRMMNSWVFQPGFPLISVAAGPAAGQITVRQERFRLLPGSDGSAQTWQVPLFVRIATADGVEQEMKLLLSDAESIISVPENIRYLLVNAAGASFIRVHYDETLTALLAAAVPALSVTERVNLLGDTWACVQAGRSTPLAFLSLVDNFAQETDPNVWDEILIPLSVIHNTLPAGHRAAFQTRVRALLQPLHEKLGWSAGSTDSPQTCQLRGDLIVALGETGNDQQVLNKAQALYRQWKENNSSLDADVADAVVSLCARTGDAQVYNELLQFLRQAKTPQEESRFLAALANFSDTLLLEQTLNQALNPSVVRTQSAPYLVADVLRNSAGARAGWNFILKNWDAMVALYPESGLVRMCSALGSLSDSTLAQEVKNFFAGRTVKGGERAVTQALELLCVNVRFAGNHQATLQQAFPCADSHEEPAEGDQIEVIKPSSDDGAKHPPRPEDGLTAVV